MSDSQLTPLERECLTMLLVSNAGGDDKFLAQIDQLTVKHREHTKVGAFVYLNVPDSLAITEIQRKVFSNLGGQSSSLENGFGAIAYVEDGKLTLLEFFTYDEAWPTGGPKSYTLSLEKSAGDQRPAPPSDPK